MLSMMSVGFFVTNVALQLIFVKKHKEIFLNLQFALRQNHQTENEVEITFPVLSQTQSC